MALILFTRSRAPLMKTSRSLKSEFRKGKLSILNVYLYNSAVCVYYANEDDYELI